MDTELKDVEAAFSEVGMVPSRIVRGADKESTFVYFFAGDTYACVEVLDTGEMVGLCRDRASARIDVWDIPQEMTLAETANRIKQFITASEVQ